MKNMLTFEPLHKKYIDDLCYLWKDQDVIRFTNIKEPCSLEESNKRIQHFLENEKGMKIPLFYVVLNNHRVCGMVGCPVINKENQEFGLFYQICKAEWGKGIGSDCASWMIEQLKANYKDPTIYADVVEDNKASIKILENLGFEYKGIEKNSFERDNQKYHVKSFLLL
jgi:ribosomal-protein-alanine N-acetyltransferase